MISQPRGLQGTREGHIADLNVSLCKSAKLLELLFVKDRHQVPLSTLCIFNVHKRDAEPLLAVIPIKAALADLKKVANGSLFFQCMFFCVHLMMSG